MTFAGDADADTVGGGAGRGNIFRGIVVGFMTTGGGGKGIEVFVILGFVYTLLTPFNSFFLPAKTSTVRAGVVTEIETEGVGRGRRSKEEGLSESRRRGAKT